MPLSASPSFIFIGIPETVIPILRFKVRNWYTGMHGWEEDEIRVIVTCTENIWYWALMEWFWMNVESWACYYMDYIPLPKFFRNWKRAWDEDEPGSPCTFEEYWGGTLGSLWHVFICDPVFHFVWSRLDQHPVDFELTLPEARTMFAYNPVHYRWVEEELERHREWEAEEAAEEAKEGAADEDGDGKH